MWRGRVLAAEALTSRQAFDMGERGRNSLKLIKLFLYIGLCAHIYGCLFYAVSIARALARSVLS